MPGIILSTQCEKLVNKGGGYPTKTVTEEVKDPFGRKHKFHKHYEARKKFPGTDYVIFICPGCHSRNKRSAYEVKWSASQKISFKCHGCYNYVEVNRESPLIIPEHGSSIGPPIGLVDPRGRPLFRERS